MHTIVRLGESLRLDTVAEGIETAAQCDALTAMGCIFGQGYLFARPLPAGGHRRRCSSEQARAPACGRPARLRSTGRTPVDGGRQVACDR